MSGVQTSSGPSCSREAATLDAKTWKIDIAEIPKRVYGATRKLARARARVCA